MVATSSFFITFLGVPVSGEDEVAFADCISTDIYPCLQDY